MNSRKAESHVNYPPPKRFMMAPVSILLQGADVEKMGAGELNTSAGEGKVETVFRV